jgi:GNAT superfamily N-acetyltransferase
MSLAIRELGIHESELIQQALEIYAGAFPAEEREPPESLLAGIRQREAGFEPEEATFHFQVAVEEGQAAGIAIFNYYPETRMGFIPYLAVHPARRNGGLGAQLYQHLVESIQQDGNSAALGVTFEVERPELAKDAAGAELRRRRIGFYQRNGARMVEPLYLIAPPMGPGLPEMAYAIMFHPLLDASARPFERWEIVAVVRTVLEFSYHLPPDSPFIKRAVASIAQI